MAVGIPILFLVVLVVGAILLVAGMVLIVVLIRSESHVARVLGWVLLAFGAMMPLLLVGFFSAVHMDSTSGVPSSPHAPTRRRGYCHQLRSMTTLFSVNLSLVHSRRPLQMIRLPPGRLRWMKNSRPTSIRRHWQRQVPWDEPRPKALARQLPRPTRNKNGCRSRSMR